MKTRASVAALPQPVREIISARDQMLVQPWVTPVGTAVLPFLILLTPLAAGAPDYISAARPNGVVGGAAARVLSAAVAEALRARSDVAEPDGALADAAAWFVAANADSRKRGSGIAARRSGFVGQVVTAAAFPIGEPEHWRRALAALARNFPVTRYGVYVSPDGSFAGVVFGHVELKVEPFPRHAHAGATLKLRGEVNRRFDRASVHVTGTDGRVEQTRFPARQFEKDPSSSRRRASERPSTNQEMSVLDTATRGFTFV
jgi:hypothetical protein